MSKPPLWFTVLAALALLWNVVGLAAVFADFQLSAADIAALPAEQQAAYAARPTWSIVASVVAVVCGTLGCVALLLRKRWASALFSLSLVGVIVQDTGLFLVAGAANLRDPVPLVLQGVVLVIAVGLVLLARRATVKSWLA